MVGIRLFPFGARPIFRGEMAVSFREGIRPLFWWVLITTPETGSNMMIIHLYFGDVYGGT